MATSKNTCHKKHNRVCILFPTQVNIYDIFWVMSRDIVYMAARSNLPVFFPGWAKRWPDNHSSQEFCTCHLGEVKSKEMKLLSGLPGGMLLLSVVITPMNCPPFCRSMWWIGSGSSASAQSFRPQALWLQKSTQTSIYAGGGLHVIAPTKTYQSHFLMVFTV